MVCGVLAQEKDGYWYGDSGGGGNVTLILAAFKSMRIEEVRTYAAPAEHPPYSHQVKRTSNGRYRYHTRSGLLIRSRNLLLIVVIRAT